MVCILYKKHMLQNVYIYLKSVIQSMPEKLHVRVKNNTKMVESVMHLIEIKSPWFKLFYGSVNI